MAKTFDSTRHPDCVSGVRAPVEIYREFLETFEVEGGEVSLEEFINYYTNLSLCIPDDDKFELIIRSVWHITGDTVSKRVQIPFFLRLGHLVF